MTEKPSDVDLEFAAVVLAQPSNSRSLKTLAQYKEWADEQIKELRVRVANQGMTIAERNYAADEDLRRKLVDARVENRELRNRLVDQTSISALRDENKDLRDEVGQMRIEKTKIRDAFRQKTDQLRMAKNEIADLRAELVNTRGRNSYWVTEGQADRTNWRTAHLGDLDTLRNDKIRKAMLDAAEKIIETLK